MTEYNKYPEYKDSGVEWLGDIPSDWQVHDPKNAFSPKSENSLDGDVHLMASQKYGVIPQAEYLKVTGKRLVEVFNTEARFKHIGQDDFLIHLRSFQGGIEHCINTGKVTAAYTVISPKLDRIFPLYAKYLLKSKYYIGGIASTTNQLRDGQSIKWKDFRKVKLPVPPIETQKRIVAFLDAEIKKIDDSVSSMESLISLLTEKRAALISETVTRGVPGEHTEFKDSSVEWLGEIPVGWDRISFGQLFKRIKTMGTGHEELLSVYREYGVIPKSSRSDNHNVASEDLSKYQIVRKNDLVINKMKAWQGSLAISEYDGIVSPAYFVFEAKTKYENNIKFLHYLMRSNSYKGFYASISKGIRLGQWDLDQKSHKSMPVLVPPVDEQGRIVSFIDRELPKIDVLIKEAKSAIALLTEKRQTLISDVVTGKIDVTNSDN